MLENNHRYDGHLIRARGTLEIYFVIDGKTAYIANPDSFNAIFTNSAWGCVEELSKQEINAFPKTDTILNPQLLSNSLSGLIVFVPNRDANPRHAHWIISLEVFSACKFDWSKVRISELNTTFEGKAPIVYGGGQETGVITDITIVRGKNANAPAGYEKIPCDLRKGCMTDAYLYLCFKKGTGRRLKELDLNWCSYNPNDDGRPEDIPKKRDVTAQGCTLNTSSNDLMQLCYKVISNSNFMGITDIDIVEGENTPAKPGYCKLGFDLNKDRGGEYIYVSYKELPGYQAPLTTEWMKYIKDTDKICDLSIPASHDSAMWEDNMDASFFVMDGACCQFYDIGKQFDLGVRGFDLRIYWSEEKKQLGICHGKYSMLTADSKLSFEDIFEILIVRLMLHPTEFLIIDITVEKDIVGSNVTKYRNAVMDLLKRYRGYIYNDGTTINRKLREKLPTVGDLRGKMFIISRPDGFHGKLEGDWNNDPWRTRYTSSTEAITCMPADALRFSYNKSPGIFGDIEKFKSEVRERNETEVSKRLIDSMTTGVPYEFMTTDPYNASIVVNRESKNYLRTNNSITRTGIIYADFMDEDGSLAWEIIKTNPDIRKLGYI